MVCPCTISWYGSFACRYRYWYTESTLWIALSWDITLTVHADLSFNRVFPHRENSISQYPLTALCLKFASPMILLLVPRPNPPLTTHQVSPVTYWSVSTWTRPKAFMSENCSQLNHRLVSLVTNPLSPILLLPKRNCISKASSSFGLCDQVGSTTQPGNSGMRKLDVYWMVWTLSGVLGWRLKSSKQFYRSVSFLTAKRLPF